MWGVRRSSSRYLAAARTSNIARARRAIFANKTKLRKQNKSNKSRSQMARAGRALSSVSTVSTSQFLGLDGIAARRALVVLNSPDLSHTPLSLLRHAWRVSSFRIYADGAANRVHDLIECDDERGAMLPNSICGDFDSLRPDVLRCASALAQRPARSRYSPRALTLPPRRLCLGICDAPSPPPPAATTSAVAAPLSTRLIRIPQI